MNKGTNNDYTKRNFIASIILILVLLTVIPMITVYELTIGYDIRTRSQISSTNEAIRRTVRSFVRGAYSLAYELAVNKEILTMDGKVQEPILTDCVERNDYLELLYIQDTEGNQTARSSGELGYRGGRDWFLRMMREKQPFVYQSYYSIATSMPVTSIFIPMHNEQEMVGVFGMDLSLSYLQSLAEEFADEQNKRFTFIIDGEGVVIAHPDNTFIETLTNYYTLVRTVTVTDENGTPLLNPDGSVVTSDEHITVSDSFKAVIDSVMSGHSGLSVIEHDGETYYAAYDYVEMPGNSDSWSVITLQERKAAMLPITQLTIRLVIIILIIFTVFILISAGFFSSLRKTMTKLETAKREAEVANKTKSAFLSTMSHEIRTPMNAVLGITEMQLYKETVTGEVKEAFEKIHTSGGMLLGILNDILDLSKIEAGKLELVIAEYETASALSDTAQLNMMRIGSKQIEFELSVPSSFPQKLIGDELRIKQILNNLLSNAFKYTEKGTVKLNVYTEPKDADTVIIVFEISDTGKGMTEEQVEHLFDEYSRFNIEANNKTEGTGLGMSITRNLLRLMNGSISIASEYGKGSTFTVRIPQKKVSDEILGDEMADNLKRFGTVHHKSFKKAAVKYEPMPYGKVLLVDDVELNIYVAKGLLAPYGLNIDFATSGAQAIEKIKNGNIYDIVFMDHMMPEMDGVEAVKIIRQMGYAHPIVALTANALVGQADIFLKNGFDDFISKPIDMRQMNIVLNNLIRDKHLKNGTVKAPEQALTQNEESAKKLEQIRTKQSKRFGEIFARDANKAIAALEEIAQKNAPYSESDIKIFTINVHGMKSAFANMGDSKLCEYAARLEAMAKNGEFDKAISLISPFLTALKQEASKYIPKTDDDFIAEQDEDKPFLKTKLEDIKTACTECDERKADTALSELRGKKWSKNTSFNLAKLAELILRGDFEKAAEFTDEI